MSSSDLFTDKGALFSPDRVYRYSLWRIWDRSRSPCLFLMLNPSTADEDTNDPTVERCERYARRWGYGGLYVGNLFAYRATDPDDMKAYTEPVGPENDKSIIEVAAICPTVVCAWGNHGQHLGRSAEVKALLHANEIKPWILVMNGTGEPSHPLYLKSSLEPRRWEYDI